VERAASRRDLALLTVAEMARAEAAAMAAGRSGGALMEAAGQAVTQAVLARWARRPVAVLCGPGNNGGDGFVVARHLARAGWPVSLALLGRREALKGEAAAAAALWTGSIRDLTLDCLDGEPLLVDALFGAGLDRPVDGVARAVLSAIGERGLPCVAVDLPSGVQGDTGQVMGAAAPAVLTVTFFKRKPAHVLFPGRALAGEVVVADIGLAEGALDAIGPRQHANGPALWLASWPWPRPQAHKYDRGHALIVAGAKMTGAARLAAAAARRIGAGLVTIAGPAAALPIIAAEAPGLLTEALEGGDFAALVTARHRNALLIGPGSGVDGGTRERVLAALAAKQTCVLDADALTVFADRPSRLFEAIALPCLLTPHEGEFGGLFPDLGLDAARHRGKLARVRGAAGASGAVLLLKGADTVIAHPDGRAIVNANAPADLATAGSGDVLAGLALGLIAQGLAPFEAAAAAAWVQGEVARRFGPGLIAEDLIEGLPALLRELRALSTGG